MTDQKRMKDSMVVGSIVPLGRFEKPSLLISEGLEYSVAGGTVSNGEKPIDQFWINQIKDLQVEISDLHRERDELFKMLERITNHLEFGEIYKDTLFIEEAKLLLEKVRGNL